MPYELNTSKLFLTYPQCNLSKEDCLAALSLVVDIDKYIIAHELHANGDHHLHCYLELHKAFRTRNAHALDLNHGGNSWHGNYQGCRSAKAVTRYVTKSEDYIANVDVAALLTRRSTRRSIAEALVLGKRTLEQMLAEFPEMVYDYGKLKSNMKLIAADLKVRTEIPDYLPNPWSLILPGWRDDKKRHYWIWSARPNVGKTHLFGKPLRDRFNATILTNFVYWDVTPKDSILILDDYNTAALSWHSVNQLADGTFQFRIFQGGYCRLDKYVVIILSNKSISELYPHMGMFISERFNEYNVDA